MTGFPVPEGNAIVYCEGAFQTTNGKTAHGLVRFTRRYNVMAVIDSTCCGCDAGELLDGELNGIPIVANLDEALARARDEERPASHFVIGIAPDGGRTTSAMRHAIIAAIRKGLSVDCGLHDFISNDSVITCLAAGVNRVKLRDVRKVPARGDLHAFTGKIADVTSMRVAILGTDSAVGKRTTAWKLVDALEAAGHSTEMIGTGQTAWMQGANYSIVLDSLINDFVAGELEHVVWNAWNERRPEFLVIEGQGSLMNPAYPGGHEILAATRPHCVVLQHAPTRDEYDGFPGYTLDPLNVQIQAIELLSKRKVVAIPINHEGLAVDENHAVCEQIERETGLPTVDVLRDGANRLAETVLEHCGKQSPVTVH
jgi:uncharacterized NAD-dependent epimerase/dehydratase family protein